MAESGSPRSVHMQAPHPVPEFEVQVEARAENIAGVRHGIAAYLADTPIGADRLSDVLLAVTEACANVVVHAYDGGTGVVEVSAWRSGGELHVVVRDHGGGMRPRVDSPGLGLGLPVLLALTTGVSIRPAPGGGTEVSLAFPMDDAPAGA